MADNVVDKEIVDLPEATGVTGDTLFPGYVPGALNPAQKITAEQLKEYFGQEVFVATYGVTAPEDVEAAYTAGKLVFCDYNGTIAATARPSTTHFIFAAINGDTSINALLNRSTGEWVNADHTIESRNFKTNVISSDSKDYQYPSAKAVYEFGQSLVIEGGGGGGLPGSDGEDGGYYIPNISQPDQYTMQVDFTASKDGMAQAPTSYIDLPPGPQGPQGQMGQPGSPGSPGMDGEDGKSAYEYAQDGGYTGTEAEFAEKLAQPIPPDLTEEVNQLSEEIADLTKTVEPEEDDMPKVFFGAPLPQTKDEIVMSFRYISKTMDVSGYCKTKAQGNSSMSYPKKNQTVKLYKDAECTEKLKIDFGNWGKQSKFCFKANWIDLTHARNIVSARLWGDVVKSRSNYAELPELLRTSPNQGAVNGFPIKLYADGIYQGRYTINIPKDAWMANMDDSLDTHCILCGENYDSGCFRAAANINGADWTDEIHDTVPDAIKTKWNEIISFVMNSTDEDFAASLGNYFDIPSLIDYYLFGVASCGLDAFGKNQLYMTYDGQKWFATMYDMDSTWGLWWTGASFVATNYARNEFQDFKDGEGNLLYIRLESLFANEIKARWAELRYGALTESNIINRFERFTDICPPWLVAEDYAETTADGAFTAIPSQSTNNIQQIRGYIVDRMAYVDEAIPNIGNQNIGLVYALPTVTTFDGVDDYIDTGIMPWQENKEFTIFADLTSDESVSVRDTAFCTLSEMNGWGFMMFQGAEGYLVPAGTDSATGVQGVVKIPPGTRGKTCVRISNKVWQDITYKIGDSSISVFTNEVGTTVDYISQYSIIIGCAINDTVTPNEFWRFWPGTMHDFRIWDRLLTDDEIVSLL